MQNIHPLQKYMKKTGLSLWENFVERFIPTPERPDVGWSQAKYYCLSDDGGGHDIPVEKRGSSIL